MLGIYTVATLTQLISCVCFVWDMGSQPGVHVPQGHFAYLREFIYCIAASYYVSVIKMNFTFMVLKI